MANTLHVTTAQSGGYDIHIGRGLLGKAGENIAACLKARGRKPDGIKAAIITDETVGILYGQTLLQSLRAAGINAHLHAFTPGEASKSHETLLGIYSFLAAQDLTRRDLIIALGGGVPGDIAGFAAATWQRGIDFIQIPTTLLAQIDSSIGGKTAVNLPEGKNLVGAFWQPMLVLCDPGTLSTLDGRIFADGMGECIKHACIKDAALFEKLKSAGGDLTACLDEVIEQNILIKKAVVERDERESGERMLLNFGHTLGHGIEKLTGFGRYTHGEAVAMGMSLITEVAEHPKNALTEPGTTARLKKLLEAYNLPSECPLPVGEVVKASLNDKKRAGGAINIVLLRKIGESFIHRLSLDEFIRFFEV